MHRLCLLLLLVLPAACTRHDAPQALAWQDALPGLTYAQAELRVGQDRQPVIVHLLRLEPRRWELRVVTPEIMARPLAGPAEFRAAVAGSVAAINGGFFEPQWKPLGLLVN